MKAPVRVVGIGSPFGADRLGWEALAALQGHPAVRTLGSQVALKTCDRPGAGLLEHLRGASLAVLVDAVQGGEALWHLYRLEREAIGRRVRPLSSHGFGVAQALSLGEALGDLPREVILYGLEVGEPPAESVPAAALDVLVEAVAGELRRVHERQDVWELN